MNGPAAHSAGAGGQPQPYPEHIVNARTGACVRAREMLAAARHDWPELVAAIAAGADLHDLGKLDPENQAAFFEGRHAQLRWDHIDAGAALAMQRDAVMSAWLIRAHHAPGLPNYAEHFGTANRRLRGRRDDADDVSLHKAQRARTDLYLDRYVALHEKWVGPIEIVRNEAAHGLTMRLALSCLVDADHADTARHDSGWSPPGAPAPRWGERLAQLDRHVAGKGGAASERNRQRAAFYSDCRESTVADPIVSCAGPVGIGKTTAVTGYLLRRAEREGLRRLIVVAPYTNVLAQTARVLREALVLPGEDPNAVVVEHHHRADFDSSELRDLAVLWQAPVVVTTAVQFFETLASNLPAVLRKLHALPGSAIFIDEAHAALPTPLWHQNWAWLHGLAHDWRCRIVLASGSPAAFWEHPVIVGPRAAALPDLLRKHLAADAFAAERRRIRYHSIRRPLENADALIDEVVSHPGPRILVMNTVQSAAVVARAMRRRGLNVMHISTALCPRDRDAILDRVTARLQDEPAGDWTLVATSCVEAGVDFSFRTGFRERFSVASLIQLGGRVNRHGLAEVGEVWDFTMDPGGGITAHPAAKYAAGPVRRFFREGAFDCADLTPGDLVTQAMLREMAERMESHESTRLSDAEAAHDYPAVARLGRVIAEDTQIVVVDGDLAARIEAGVPMPFRELLAGSVQLWGHKVAALRLDPLRGRNELYRWTLDYDPDLLGIMDGVLKIADFEAAGGAVI